MRIHILLPAPGVSVFEYTRVLTFEILFLTATCAQRQYFPRPSSISRDWSALPQIRSKCFVLFILIFIYFYFQGRHQFLEIEVPCHKFVWGILFYLFYFVFIFISYASQVPSHNLGTTVIVLSMSVHVFSSALPQPRNSQCPRVFTINAPGHWLQSSFSFFCTGGSLGIFCLGYHIRVVWQK